MRIQNFKALFSKMLIESQDFFHLVMALLCFKGFYQIIIMLFRYVGNS